MNSQKRQEAFAYYRAQKGVLDWNPLMDYASKVLACRDRIEKQVQDVSFSKESAEQAIQSAKPYLQLCSLRIDSERFISDCIQLVESFIDSEIIHDEQISEILAIDWNKLRSETIEKVGEDPNAFFDDAVLDLAGSSVTETQEVVLAGILINVVRAYLNPVGLKMTNLLSHEERDLFRKAPFLCPTCGGPASLAQVTNQENSFNHTRKLFCACCGTTWDYEKERCGLCGEFDGQKLDYIYTEEDPRHRLHLCSRCHGVLPTVFQDAISTPFDFDIEQNASSIIESVWLEHQLMKSSQKIIDIPTEK
ncbi:MAG: formate dehydrogenase accessory protein FdhE [Burkholderiaceae bacterium]|nr:formate dehydrogenase accessory protein FdhE [Burkholderiaceae bacterium]